MMASCIAFLLAAAVQEAKPDQELERLRDEVAKAMAATAKAGSFSVSGRITVQAGDDEEEPAECRVTGSVATPFQAALRIRSKGNLEEVYLKDGRIAGRSTWKGRPLAIGEMPNELLSLCHLSRLESAAGSATSAKPVRTDKLESVDCRVIEFSLPPSAVRTYWESEDEEETSSVEGVDLRVWIDQARGLVLKLDATVRRVEKDEDNPADGTRTQSRCSLTLSDHGKAKVELPAKIKEQLED